jgi:hypothetical protein
MWTSSFMLTGDTHSNRTPARWCFFSPRIVQTLKLFLHQSQQTSSHTCFFRSCGRMEKKFRCFFHSQTPTPLILLWRFSHVTYSESLFARTHSHFDLFELLLLTFTCCQSRRKTNLFYIIHARIPYSIDHQDTTEALWRNSRLKGLTIR